MAIVGATEALVAAFALSVLPRIQIALQAETDGNE